MHSLALALNALAALLALYVAKLLVLDVAWSDHKVHGGGFGPLAICLAIGAALVLLPGALGLPLALRGRGGASLGVGAGALVLDGIVWVIVAAAFTP